MKSGWVVEAVEKIHERPQVPFGFAQDDSAWSSIMLAWRDSLLLVVECGGVCFRLRGR